MPLFFLFFFFFAFFSILLSPFHPNIRQQFQAVTFLKHAHRCGTYLAFLDTRLKDKGENPCLDFLNRFNGHSSIIIAVTKD